MNAFGICVLVCFCVYMHVCVNVAHKFFCKPVRRQMNDVFFVSSRFTFWKRERQKLTEYKLRMAMSATLLTSLL
jgi:hypothetical protein